jgi:uncharacterized membrane protein (DUF2068 family)
VSEREPRDPWILLIGIGKMLKATALVILGVAALLLVHHDVVETLRHVAIAIGLAPGGHFVREAIAGAGELDDHQLREIGVALFVYAGLFTLEGTGLLLRRRWGEWVTIIITGSFIPIEAYETARSPHVGRAVTLVLNLAAVAYLAYRLRKGHGAKTNDALARKGPRSGAPRAGVTATRSAEPPSTRS